MSLSQIIRSSAIILATAASALSQITITSAADYGSRVAPSSISAIFGTNMASQQTAATPSPDGSLPTSLDGTSVTVNGVTARLFFVSPSQLNIAIPDQTPAGDVPVVITSPTGTQSGVARIQLAAPGIFTIPCLRGDRAAAENAITGQLEPFHATTQENPGSDKRTHLSFYGTGVRYAGNAARDNTANVASRVTATLTDTNGKSYPLTVDYAGKQPTLIGLDQINVTLPAETEGLGIVQVHLTADGVQASPVTIALSGSSPAAGSNTSFTISSVTPVASTSQTLGAQLRMPAAVAIDGLRNLYIADTGNHVVRKLDTAGVLTTFAGTGVSGNSGDGQQATAGQLKSPVGLAFDRQGNLYIADAEDNRIRKVSAAGVMTTFAGTGTAGLSGDNGPANTAAINAPGGITVNPYGTVVFADSGNNRVRRVTSDGLISTIAGAGSAPTNILNSAYSTGLNHPSDVAADGGGNIFVADAGNFLIRRISQGGSIFTIGGSGAGGSSGTNCPATQASFGSAVRLAADSSGRLFISDTNNQKVRVIDATCFIYDAAGTGTAGFSGDNGPATQAQLNSPSGLTVDGNGDVYIADATNNRVRRLGGGPVSLVFSPANPVSGQPVTVTVNTGSILPGGGTVQITPNTPIPGLGGTVTIPAGSDTGSVTFNVPSVTSPTPITISATGPGGTASGTTTVFPTSGSGTGVATVSIPAGTTTGGTPVTGVVTLNGPAPAGGTTVSLQSNSPAAQVPATVTIAQGNTSGEFLVMTTGGASPTGVTISGSAAGTTASGGLTVNPTTGSGGTGTGGSGTVMVSGISVNPSSVVGGTPATATVTLSGPAPAGGTTVSLTSSGSGITVPSTITIPAGQTSGSATVQTPLVNGTTSGSVSASAGGNTVSAPISLLPALPAAPQISGVSLSGSSVTGGTGVTGTVSLTSPAPAGGSTVQLSSNSGSVSVPSSVTVPAGQSSTSFNVATSPVNTGTAASVTATGANSASAPLMVNAPCVSGFNGGLSVTNPTTGAGAINGTVMLNGAAPTGGTTVDISNGNASIGSAVVPAGQTSGQVNINVANAPSLVGSSVTATTGACGGVGLHL